MCSVLLIGKGADAHRHMTLVGSSRPWVSPIASIGLRFGVGEGQLQVVVEPGDAHADEAQRARTVGERPVEQRRTPEPRSASRRRCRPASEVERVRIEKSGYRTLVVTVRATWPRPRRYSPSRAAIRSSSSCSRAGSPTSRANVSSCEIEMRSTDCSSGRGSMPRARSRSSRPTLPGSVRASVASSSAASCPTVSTPDCGQSLLGLRADARQAGGSRTARGTPPRGRAARR